MEQLKVERLHVEENGHWFFVAFIFHHLLMKKPVNENVSIPKEMDASFSQTPNLETIRPELFCAWFHTAKELLGQAFSTVDGG